MVRSWPPFRLAGRRAVYRQYHIYIDWRWLMMELATLCRRCVAVMALSAAVSGHAGCGHALVYEHGPDAVSVYDPDQSWGCAILFAPGLAC